MTRSVPRIPPTMPPIAPAGKPPAVFELGGKEEPVYSISYNVGTKEILRPNGGVENPDAVDDVELGSEVFTVSIKSVVVRAEAKLVMDAGEGVGADKPAAAAVTEFC
jgi:hypothetical protein